jgi:hypothetical protein
MVIKLSLCDFNWPHLTFWKVLVRLHRDSLVNSEHYGNEQGAQYLLSPLYNITRCVSFDRHHNAHDFRQNGHSLEYKHVKPLTSSWLLAETLAQASTLPILTGRAFDENLFHSVSPLGDARLPSLTHVYGSIQPANYIWLPRPLRSWNMSQRLRLMVFGGIAGRESRWGRRPSAQSLEVSRSSDRAVEAIAMTPSKTQLLKTSL